MTVVRAGLRTQRLQEDDNLMANDPDSFLGHESDFLALMLAKPPAPGQSNNSVTEKWKISKKIVYRIERDALPLNDDDRDSKAISAAAKAFFFRSRLSRMTGLHGSGSEHNSNWGAKFVPVREVAMILTQAIEDTMMILWASHRQHPVQLHDSWEKNFVAYWSVSCSMGSDFLKSRLQMSLRRSVDSHGIPDGPWKADASEIEAVLSLWLWSMGEPVKSHDKEDPDIKAVEPRINRILSFHSHAEDRDDDFDGDMQLSLWYKRATTGLKLLKLRNHHLVDLPRLQHAVWWRDGDQFITNDDGPPAASNDWRRFFGWSNVKKGPMKGLSVAHQTMPSNSSLLLNYAHELYNTFLTRITQVVKDLGGNSQATQHGGFISASNETVDEVQTALVAGGLCAADEAFACTIPTLIAQGLLQPPEEMIAMVGKLGDNHHQQKRWSKYADLSNWRLRLLHDNVSKLSHGQDLTGAKETTKKLPGPGSSESHGRVKKRSS
ncbi:hypothetical protein CEP54_012306 [Fusarium duplospermum]|uniref:Uncharacterized protein n=1 Tax=Fusarium duplospermum TaxID=1325734 RepID=A0A428P9C8_9HYPO|nr:hypothetical protein CEP54_012306 [Fusarium duplospermum]